MNMTANPLDIHGEAVSYQADGTRLEGYVAWDDSKTGPRPGVIVVHEWWGHNEYVRRRARMLAELGYVAFALDMYGDGKNTEHPEEAQKLLMAAISDPAVATRRFFAACEALKQHHATDPSKIAAIGYCFGGAVVLQMARLGADLAGVASFHGTLSPQGMPAQPGAVKAKVLVLHGAADPLVPKAQLAAFEREMNAAGVDYEVIEYPGAMHAFTNPQATERGEKLKMPLAYDASADAKSWAELQKFLQGLFAGR
jgi:dienelactone hydrolase